MKQYEELIATIKQMVTDGNVSQEVAEKYFPELKESEDEQIRKWIIDDIRYNMNNEPLNNSEYIKKAEKAIAWLKKQGKCEFDCPQNHQDVNRPNGCIVLEDFNGGEGFYKVHLDYLNKKQVEEIEEMIRVWNKELKTPNENIKDCIGICLTDADEQRFKDFNTNLKECLVWLEKQGEKPQGKSALEAANEEKVDNQNCVKPADNVEPIFKVGQWIVKNDGKDCFSDGSYVLQITDVDGIKYKLSNGCYLREPFTDTYRLWTIQDAKDGDVLCTYECCEPKIVFILKGTSKKHYALSYHCYYNIMYPHFASDSEKGCLAPKDEDVKPATKEQRDLLFQKMKEAGYEFDFKKKELKKIEYESQIKKNFQDNNFRRMFEQESTECKEKKYSKCYVYNLPHNDEMCEQCEFNPKNKKLVEWSEEDEKLNKAIIEGLEAMKSSFHYISGSVKLDDSIIWLKSLKDRVQPKQEWSDVDKDILFRIMDDLKFLRDDISKDTKYAVNIVDVEREINWLKSLRPQNTWKPSEGQLECLGYAIEKAEINWSPLANNRIYLTLKALKEQLEKL